jgi:hypothetical protein
MVKVWGSILTLAGSVVLLFCVFLYLNSSAYLDYNATGKTSVLDVGLALPFVMSALVATFGVILLATSKDKDYSEHDHH